MTVVRLLDHKDNRMLGRLVEAVRQEIATSGKLHEPFKLKWEVTIDDASHWVIIKVDAAEPYDANIRMPREFAMWRETRAVYQVINAAVLDDPVLTEAVMDQGPVLAP